MTTIILQPGSNKKPRIGYQNLFEDAQATITASSDSVGYEKENGYDGKAFTYWKPASGSSNWIQIFFPSARTVTYWGAYACGDLATYSGNIKLQYSSDGAAWTDFDGGASPASSEPIYHFSAAVSATYWRFLVTCATQCRIGVLSLGQDFIFERGMWIGFEPPITARETIVTNVMSNNGIFLGRSLIRSGSKSQISLDFITPAWIRNTWLPFMRYAEKKPFWLLWDSIDYPLETAWCIADGQGAFASPQITRTAFMNCGVKFLAQVE